jgi:regulator of sirC expression with transglutaminase-like and TPR domain
MARVDHAIRLNPAYVEAFTNRGLARAPQGDINGALEDYDAAIELRPADPYAHFNRAGIRARRGDHSGAIADLQTYLDSGAGIRDGDQAAVERLIADYRSRL